MPTPTKGTRFGGSPAHQRLILANLATSLFEHGRITTTEAKARRLRPFAEQLITKAKHGDLHARRQVMAKISDKSVVHTLFTEIGPRFATRPGGYTRITKIGPRKGDNAPMAVIELVEEMPARAEPASAPARASTAAAPAVVAAPADEVASTADEEPAANVAPAPDEELAADDAPAADEEPAADEALAADEEQAADDALAADEEPAAAAEPDGGDQPVARDDAAEADDDAPRG